MQCLCMRAILRPNDDIACTFMIPYHTQFGLGLSAERARYLHELITIKYKRSCIFSFITRRCCIGFYYKEHQCTTARFRPKIRRDTGIF